jgi:hypothetical protein
MVLELVDQNEFGVAFELLRDVLIENGKPLPNTTVDALVELAELMQLDVFEQAPGAGRPITPSRGRPPCSTTPSRARTLEAPHRVRARARTPGVGRTGRRALYDDPDPSLRGHARAALGGWVGGEGALRRLAGAGAGGAAAQVARARVADA